MNKREAIKEKEWYEALYWARIDAFVKLTIAWQEHDPDHAHIIEKIARGIIIKTKPNYEK
tara:strand:+ start:78 stop:257 length:180 start_codon:yes stop_codon:yes gene_type:complete